MESMSFSAYQDLKSTPLNHCSCASSERPLMVNCAGQFVASRPFATYNRTGRLDYYLLYIVSGRLEIPMGDTTVVAKRGCAVVFPPNAPYRYSYTGGETLCYRWVHFTGSEAEKMLSLCGFSPLPCIRHMRETEYVSHGFKALFGAFGAQDAFRDRELSAVLECLLIAFGRAIGAENGKKTELSVSLRHIVTAYASEIKIPSLAAMEHLSVPRYNAKFKKLMGTSPTRYSLELRMGAACDLLRNTDFSVKEIAAMCGYRDPYFFSRAFKEYTGLSPRAYRGADG